MNKIKYTKGKYATGGVTQNSQVIEHFLTDNKEVGTKNLSTHYDSDTGVVRLKNYETIIAERDGSNVRLSTKKYSATTSKIQNEVSREAKSMGLNIVDREMFADGGEIESKIKERLANASFELPLECIVYVPSTKDANAIIPKNEMQQRVKEVQKFLSNIFGGYSSANVDGGYVSSDKGLIQEDVVKVTAFATKDAIQKSMPKLVKRIQQWCNQWSQESVGFEFEGDLFYISKDSTFSQGGMMYGDGGTAEEQNKHMILSQAKQVAHHVEELQEILAKDPTIDSWVVAKMQDVSTGLSNITHYLDGKSEYAVGGEIILGGGSMASAQDSIMANGAKLKSGKLTLGKLKSMIEEYNSEGRNFELGGAYNQLELWSNGNRIEAGSKEDIYRALVRYRFNPKYADGAELPEEIDFSTMTDEEIINFANTLSYYDRMDEGIEEEFDDVEDAKEYILLMEKGV